jgi:hypothetical protein
MLRILFFLSCLLTFTFAKAQNPVKTKAIEPVHNETDTVKPHYINQGKIAGKKAIYRSLIFPGLGQVYNYGLITKDIKSGKVQGKQLGKKIGIIGKIGGIYVAGTMLTLSYIDNNRKYHQFLTELQYRRLHNNAPDPNGGLSQYPNTDNLLTAKAIYKNNREVVLISLGLTYGLNVLDAYITARLKYVNVTEDLSFKISPSVINSNTMYGYNSSIPALKLTLKL